MNDLIPQFILFALLGGIGVAIVAGPLGAFVVWRRMAYFGDTLAHGALLGIALGFFLAINPYITLVASSVLMATLLAFLQKQRWLASDTLLGILSHGALAAGLVCISLIKDVRVDLMAFLFGDLLTITTSDLILIWVVGIAVLATLYFLWRPLLLATLDEDLAKVEGIATDKLRLALLILVALVVALAMRVVGVLLITALMIIPAAAARPISKSPEAMAITAALIGAVAVILGMFSSYQWDIPAGPAIVLCSVACFIGISMLKVKA